MMAKEGRSRKQHLLSALSHVSRWERNRVETQQISSESLHSGRHLLHSLRLFLMVFSVKQKTTPSSSGFLLKHMVMMAEEGRSRKQHLLSALSHVSRWERNRVETQQISSESLHSGRHLLHSLGLFLMVFSAKQKTTPSSSWFLLKHHNPWLHLDSLNRFTISQSLHYHFHFEPAQNQYNRFIPPSFTLNSFHHLGVGFSSATTPVVAGVDDVALRCGGIAWWCSCRPCKEEDSV